MTPKKTLAGLGATVILMGGVDASVLAETPLERVEIIANEHVEAKQVENVVETTLPWKGETGLKVKYDMGEPTLLEKVKDKRTKEVVTEKVDFGDGGFKVDILLNEKPNTNVFCYQIEGAENYDFFYQPPLTAEEIAEGAERPEEIEGSYAVYHKTLKNHRIGGENYATGKVMHIPRPQVWELNNEESTKEWADLSYSEQDGLCVTARQEFLDKATYPVRIDPTFGYTSVGATFVQNLANRLIGSTFTSPSDISGGTVSSISISGGQSGGNRNVKGVIVLRSSLTIVSNGIGNTVVVSAAYSSPVWNVSTLSSSPSLSNSTDYVLCNIDDAGGFYVRLDTGFTGLGGDDTTNSYSSPTDPTDMTFTSGYKYSIYATYTASGGSATTSDEIFWFE